MNRLHLAGNPYQTTVKKVLCVCSAGLLRSPTTAVIQAGHPWNFNTRAAGVYDSALIPVDPVLVQWASEIVCMEDYHADVIRIKFKDDLEAGVAGVRPKSITLGILDNFAYRDPKLINHIKEAYTRELERILHPSSDSGFGEEQRP